MSRAGLFQDGDDLDVERFVAAECRACGDVHLLEEREIDDTTVAATSCPECGSPEYSTAIRERYLDEDGEEVDREA